jgi:TonB-linked SusC/RagA family outer membrane protein
MPRLQHQFIARRQLTKTLRIMRLTAILLLTASLQISARGLGQTLTLHLENAPLQQAFQEIERQCGYSFVYGKEQLSRTRPVNLSISDADLETVLKLVFKDQPLSYTISGNYIAIRQIPVLQAGDGSPSPPTIDIHGRVTDSVGNPLAGVTVSVKGSTRKASTDENGEFFLKTTQSDATLVFTSVNMETFQLKVKGETELSVSLKPKLAQLGEVSVEVNTGYQKLPKERATGSFDNVDNALINRSVTTNILDRIENLTPGLLFNHGDASVTGDTYLIRGRSTIYANSQPLIVLDNFPYDGSLSDINPNDIESVSILKDAAAASIWGARAGNGVIVLTSKKGRTNKPLVSLNTNVTVQGRPDLFNIKMISPSDYIGLEKNLYAQGYYTNTLTLAFPYFQSQPITPVVELLKDADSGYISSADANAQISALASHDVRNDLKKYFYQTSVNQQHSVSVSGNTPNVNYYFSAGWDHNLSNTVASTSDRITLKTLNTFHVNKDIDFVAGISYVQGITQNGNNIGTNLLTNPGLTNLYPYAQLADAHGNPLPVNLYYRPQYVNSLQATGFQSWQYSPLADIHDEQNKVNTRDFLINTGLNAKILPGLTARLLYQFEDQLITTGNYYNDSSYFTRNIINQYTQVDPTTGALSFPIPLGGIFMGGTSELISHQGRAEVDYDKAWQQGMHRVSAIAGYEIKSAITTGNAYQYYGYEPGYSQTQPAIDYIDYFNQQPIGGSAQIPTNQGISKTTDHFISYFANAAYTFNDKYILSGSARLDEANLFGLQTNQKGAPLWHTGAAWIMSRESFYQLSWLPLLKLRATYGASGNIARNTSAVETISPYPSLTTGAAASLINNPPNKDLRWERDKQLNFGVDFATTKDRLSGTIEYYRKNGTDLMGEAPIDPTLGLGNGTSSFYFGNVANTKGNGVDISISTKNIDGKFKWQTNIIFSHSTSIVTRYLMPPSPGNSYLTINPNFVNPIVGRPVFGMYSFRWAGLDPTNGDPQGYLGGKNVSKDWASIYSQTSLDSMVYNGSLEPVYFGAIRNSFSYMGVSLSFNISYKFGYYFRRQSVSYYTLVHNWNGSSEYAKRWQKPGDEKTTNVPSLPTNLNTLDPNRDAFYQYSQALVEKADNIRLEDITLSYDVAQSKLKTTPIKSLRLYFYASNLGKLWVANKEGIDPYYNNVAKPAKSLAIGLNANF